jgi:glutaredoxin
VKALLSREGVPFTAYNVDEDDRAYDELVARGFRTIPVTIFDDHRDDLGVDVINVVDVVDVVIRGFDEPALRSAIAAWRARAGGRKPADSQ